MVKSFHSHRFGGRSFTKLLQQTISHIPKQTASYVLGLHMFDLFAARRVSDVLHRVAGSFSSKAQGVSLVRHGVDIGVDVV